MAPSKSQRQKNPSPRKQVQQQPQPKIRSYWMTGEQVFLLLLAFRILNALTLKTFFQPDEYYQSLEPAWRLAFGEDSGAWITWVGYQH
jgi:phosphatidylinositol glycan class B